MAMRIIQLFHYKLSALLIEIKVPAFKLEA
jgi:hypothetical protein